MTVDDGTDGRSEWLPRSGVAAAVGGLLWAVTPWVRAAVLGDRPYVASAFDAASLAGWALMAAGLVGARKAFGDRYGRLGRVGVGTTAAGMALAAVPLVRSVLAFVDAGFRAVPATGEDPAGLVVTWTTILGLGLAVGGAGALGLALRRLADPPTAAVALLLAAPTVPAAAVTLRLLSALPVPVGRVAVRTNVSLLPFAFGWVALGAAVWSRSRSALAPPTEND